ncbi:hypothetical protein ARMSODRAFT_1026562 [Armillaria solidipes]|uniref:Uncharacterized protein n=1 Tax=Armillaria solidipes TaxID=1076256 RepID=A0A2H3AUG9_9AGAR|nr:hypothetical protein ARMSODRAFT_1026562 [Armillaria solidipes]
MSTEPTTNIKSTKANKPITFFLSWRYDISIPFTRIQIAWLEAILPDYEQAVVESHLDQWLDAVFFSCWFARWPENPYQLVRGAEEKDTVAHKRALVQILTMKLETRWSGAIPNTFDSDLKRVMAALDWLHD